MDRALRVLHLEDDDADAGLVRDVLDAGGIVCDVTRVQTREEFVASLRNGFDVILADYSLPSFDGLSALKIAALRSPDVPFIFFSGALGEELAIEALKTGATDYVLKERPSSLVPSVQRALREARERLERKRAEEALRASEERFRALVQFSFDVYWESDAEHRFTRQEFSERLTDAPARGAELGKTRWEIPYVEPDEEAWRKHRATLDAHLPFRDFELARPSADGGTRYVSVSGIPAFDEIGRFVGYRGVGRHITERKRAEREHQAHLWFLESMDRINRAMQGSQDLQQMLSDVLLATLDIFACDRAWLIYPCDPDAPSWHAVMEQTRPEFSGAFALQAELPVDRDIAAAFAAARAAPGAVMFGPDYDLKIPALAADRFAVRSQMAMAIDAKADKPYLFGLHQCARARVWTAEEERLFQEIGRRLSDAVSALSILRSLRDSERKLDAAQRIAHVGWWERDLVAGRASLSDEAWRIFGAQPVDMPQWHGRWLSLIHPEDRSRAAAASEAALGGGARYDVEYRVVRPDGTVRMVHSQGDVIRDDSGRALRQFGVMQDITELRQTERRLEEAQRMARVGWWERDLVAGRVAFSDQVWEFYGIPVQDRLADLAEWKRRLPALIHEDDREKVLGAYEVSIASGRRVEVIYRAVRPDGTMRVGRGWGDTMLDESGRPLRQFGVVQDITELWQAEQELRARQEMLDLAQKAARAVAFDWFIGARESENRWSPELEAMYGLQPGTFDRTFQGWKKLVHPDDWPSAKLALQRAHESGDIAAEYRIIHKDGSVHWLHAKGRMFFDAQGRPERMVGFMIDVTDRRHAEEALRTRDEALQLVRAELAHVSRMTTLGELTASIAHEVNQPLGAMVANAAACVRWLSAQPPDTANARRALESIVAGGRRAGEVIGRIRALVKRQAARKAVIDMNEAIAEVVALVRQELRSNDIQLATRFAGDLPPVLGDRVQLQQVLLNLIVNAIEAMSAVADRARELAIASSLDGPDAVVVEVRDSGQGLDAERAERLFDAFYTTKVEGVGIGLSISRSIVEEHGGRLWAAPNAPHGAVFRFSLPAEGRATP